MSNRSNSVSLFNADGDRGLVEEGTNLLAAMVFDPLAGPLTIPFRDTGEPTMPYRVLSDQVGSIPAPDLEILFIRTATRDPTRRTSQWWRMPSEAAPHFAGYLPVSEDIRDAYERGAPIAGGMGLVSSTRSLTSAAIGGTVTAFNTTVRVDPTTLSGSTIQRLLKAAGSGAVNNAPIGKEAVWLSDEFFTPPVDYWMTDAVEPDGAMLSRNRDINDMTDGPIVATPLIVYDTSVSTQSGLLPPWAKGRAVFDITWCGDMDPIPAGRDGNYNAVIEVTRTSTDFLTGLAVNTTVQYGICGGWSQFGLGGRMSYAVNGTVESDEQAPITRIVLKLNAAHQLPAWKAVTSVINFTVSWPNLLDTGEVQPMNILLVRGLTVDQSLVVQTADVYSVVPTSATALISNQSWSVASPHDTMRLMAYLARQQGEYAYARVAKDIVTAASSYNPISVDRNHQSQYMNADWKALFNTGRKILGAGLRGGGAIASVLGQPEVGVPLSALGTVVGNTTFFNADGPVGEFSSAMQAKRASSNYYNGSEGQDSGSAETYEAALSHSVAPFSDPEGPAPRIVRFSGGSNLEGVWTGRLVAVLEENLERDDSMAVLELIMSYLRAADDLPRTADFKTLSDVTRKRLVSWPWPPSDAALDVFLFTDYESSPVVTGQ